MKAETMSPLTRVLIKEITRYALTESFSIFTAHLLRPFDTFNVDGRRPSNLWLKTLIDKWQINIGNWAGSYVYYDPLFYAITH